METTLTEGITDTDINLTDTTTTGTQETTLTATTILNFNDSSNCYIADDGYMYILADDVARELGLDDEHFAKNGENDISPNWNTINQYLEEEGYPRVSSGTYMHEYDVLALAMRANTDKAKQFRRTVSEVIIQYFKAQVSPDRFVKMKQPREEVEENRDEADYPDDVEMNDPFYDDTAIIAKDYGMSAQEFIAELDNLCIIYLAHAYYPKKWALCSYCAKKGYVVTKIEEVVGYTGEITFTPIIIRWTQKGKEFLYHELKEYGILPVNEDKSPLEPEATPDCLKQESLPVNEDKSPLEPETDHDDLKQDFVRHVGQTSLPVNKNKSPLETETPPDCLKQGFHQEALLSNYVFVPTATPFGIGFRQVYLPNLAPGNKPVIVFEDQKYNDTLK